MNDLVKFGGSGLPTSTEDLQQGLQHVSAGLSGRSGGMPILRLLKSGVYAYGQEDIEPQEGSEWAVNPHSFQHGFACWGDGELLGEAMVPLNQPPPNVNDLQDFGEPWDQQISFQLQCMNGEDKGVTVVYKSTSVGYLNMAKALIDRIVLQLQHEPTKYVPVVALDMDSYHHRQWGTTYFPILDPKRWISIEGESDEPENPDKEEKKNPDKGEPAKQTAEKPKRSRKRAAVDADPDSDESDDTTAEAEASETAEADEQPKSRRRRRRAS